MRSLIKQILKEETQEVLFIPGLNYFPDRMGGLKNFIQKKNIKRWSLDDNLSLGGYDGDLTWLEGLVSITGFLDLERTEIKLLGNLQSVGHSLELKGTPIESIDNLQSVVGYLGLRGTQIKSLPKLQSVGGSLDLRGTKIKTLENLKSVGGSLHLNEYLSEKYTNEEIRSMINVGEFIFRRN
jgi:hypothetical protein